MALALAAVVVGDLGQRINQRPHPPPVGIGHRHRRQDEGATHLLDLEHRPEAGEDARREQAFDALEQLRLADSQPAGDLGVGFLADRKAALQVVDEGAVHLVDEHRLRHSGLHSA